MPLVRKVALALEGGVNMVQLREKDLPGGKLLEMARQLRRVAHPEALFLVNERVDVALACEADGVHLGEEALSTAAARRIAGNNLLIGRSVHSVEGAVAAQEEGADFLLVGTIFETGSHPGVEPAGLDLLRNLGAYLHIPFAGIGGIRPSNAHEVIATGASGVAVISAILASEDPKRAAQTLRKAIDAAWKERTVGCRG